MIIPEESRSDFRLRKSEGFLEWNGTFHANLNSNYNIRSDFLRNHLQLGDFGGIWLNFPRLAHRDSYAGRGESEQNPKILLTFRQRFS